MEVKLFVSDTCPYCVEARKFVEERDLDIKIINLSKEKEYMEELLRLGGKLQVPMLAVGQEAIYESKIILEYLEENYS